MTFSRLADKIHFIEATHSLEKLQQMARDDGVSPSGTKREIIERILVKKVGDWKPPAAPMTSSINIVAHFDSLLAKWSREFHVRKPKLLIVQIDKTIEYHAPTLVGYDCYGTLGFGKEFIYFHPMATAAARKGPGPLRSIESGLAHEFGHHVSCVRRGHPGDEHEAEAIQMKLSGMDEDTCWELIEDHLPYGYTEVEKTVEAEMLRLAREGYRPPQRLIER